MTPTDCTKTPSTALQSFLMLSYAYYIRMESLVSDTTYDAIAKYLLKHYDDEDFEHQHKYLVTKDMLKAGTAFNLKESDYPLIVVGAAELWIREFHYEQSQKIKVTEKVT